jgi:hypothetical protein
MADGPYRGKPFSGDPKLSGGTHTGPLMPRETQRVKFQLICMECCGQLLCWVNPRLPNHCPECGKFIYPAVKGWITFADEFASLRMTKDL